MINELPPLNEDSFVVKNDFENLLVISTGFTFFFGIIQISLIGTTKAIINALIPLSPIYPMIILGWIYTFDRRPKIIISSNGICTKKSGQLNWDEIEYTALDFIQGNRKGIDKFILKQKKRDTAFSLDISNYDKKREEINEAIESYSVGKGIVNLGVSDIS